MPADCQNEKKKIIPKKMMGYLSWQPVWATFYPHIKQQLVSIPCMQSTKPMLQSYSILGMGQWQTYLKCGGCVLIKHGGNFNEGCNRKPNNWCFIRPLIHMCNEMVLYRLLHICSFVYKIDNNDSGMTKLINLIWLLITLPLVHFFDSC